MIKQSKNCFSLLKSSSSKHQHLDAHPTTRALAAAVAGESGAEQNLITNEITEHDSSEEQSNGCQEEMEVAGMREEGAGMDDMVDQVSISSSQHDMCMACCASRPPRPRPLTRHPPRTDTMTPISNHDQQTEHRRRRDHQHHHPDDQQSFDQSFSY